MAEIVSLMEQLEASLAAVRKKAAPAAAPTRSGEGDAPAEEAGLAGAAPGAADGRVVSAPSTDVRPPCASEAGPGLPGPEDGRPHASGQDGACAGDGVNGGHPHRRPLAVLDVCDNEQCGLVGPDQVGLSLSDGEQLGFCSTACFVLYVRRRWIDGQRGA